MRILLTGAMGFTGRHFTYHATAAGHKILALQSNINDLPKMSDEILQLKPNAVVHLAALSFINHQDDGAFYHVNTIGTSNLLNVLCLLDTKPDCVLLASSANIYGNCIPHDYNRVLQKFKKISISETQAPSPINHYAVSKLAMEHIAHTFAKQLPIIITRPFNYTGSGQNINFIIPKLVKHFASRTSSISLGNLDVRREYNDVQMICQAYLQLLQIKAAAGQTYNICSGITYAIQEVLDLLQKITDHKPKIIIHPELIRTNEIHNLCGNPEKLNILLNANDKRLNIVVLENILNKMLATFIA